MADNVTLQDSDLASAPSGTVVATKEVNGAQVQLVSTYVAPLTGNAPSAVSVGATSGLILAANTSRKGLVLCNTSNADMSLCFKVNSAVLYSGITILAGASWTMTKDTFTTDAIYGIASAGSSNMGIQEFQ